jgi:hypothetical protein
MRRARPQEAGGPVRPRRPALVRTMRLSANWRWHGRPKLKRNSWPATFDDHPMAEPRRADASRSGPGHPYAVLGRGRSARRNNDNGLCIGPPTTRGGSDSLLPFRGDHRENPSDLSVRGDCSIYDPNYLPFVDRERDEIGATMASIGFIGHGLVPGWAEGYAFKARPFGRLARGGPFGRWVTLIAYNKTQFLRLSKTSPSALMPTVMDIYVFASDTDPCVVGFTYDETGSNLPAALGPWREEVEPGIIVIDTDDDPIAQAVRRDGFFVSTDG